MNIPDEILVAAEYICDTSTAAELLDRDVGYLVSVHPDTYYAYLSRAEHLAYFIKKSADEQRACETLSNRDRELIRFALNFLAANLEDLKSDASFEDLDIEPSESELQEIKHKMGMS